MQGRLPDPRQAGGVGVADARGDVLTDRRLDLGGELGGASGRHVSDPPRSRW